MSKEGISKYVILGLLWVLFFGNLKSVLLLFLLFDVFAPPLSIKKSKMYCPLLRIYADANVNVLETLGRCEQFKL